MLQQTLTYYLTGSTAVLQGENTNELIFSDVSLFISGSEYETNVPGGFSSTVGTIRIELYSGSILIASFPYDQTNLIINSSSAQFSALPEYNVTFGLNLKSQNYFTDFYTRILESASLSPIAFSDLSEFYINVLAFSSSKYIVETYSGDNKYNVFSLYDATSSLLLTSSWVTGSGSVVLELTGSSFYYFDMVVSGSTCCTPTLNSIVGIGYERLEFTYTTGSCGTFNSMSVFQSIDKSNWNFLSSGSSATTIISDSGSYPSSITYYRLVQNCDDGMETYNSDPSSIITFYPSPSPNVPNYYYVNIVGRINTGSSSKPLYISLDSGSTQTDLGYFDYTTAYQPITSFFIYSGSTLIINPNSDGCGVYGVGYNGAFSGYCGTKALPSGNFGTIISASTTIYVNVDNTGNYCC